MCRMNEDDFYNDAYNVTRAIQETTKIIGNRVRKMQLSILQASARARGRLYGCEETVKSVRMFNMIDLESPTAGKPFKAVEETRRFIADVKGWVGDQDSQPSFEHVWTQTSDHILSRTCMRSRSAR